MRPTSFKRAAGWIPAAAVLTASAMTVAGISLVPGATAASSVSVNGVISTTLTTDPTLASACTPTHTDAPTTRGGMDLVGFGVNGFGLTGACAVTFSGNHASGVRLVFSNGNGTAPFLCLDSDRNDVTGATNNTTARNCAGGSVNNVDPTTGLSHANTGTLSAGTNGSSGITLTSVAAGTTGPTPAVPTGYGYNTAAAPTAGAEVWAPVTSTGGRLCETSVPAGGATCGFQIGAHGSTSQASGGYSGTVSVTAQDNI